MEWHFVKMHPKKDPQAKEPAPKGDKGDYIEITGQQGPDVYEQEMVALDEEEIALRRPGMFLYRLPGGKLP